MVSTKIYALLELVAYRCLTFNCSLRLGAWCPRPFSCERFGRERRVELYDLGSEVLRVLSAFENDLCWQVCRRYSTTPSRRLDVSVFLIFTIAAIAMKVFSFALFVQRGCIKDQRGTVRWRSNLLCLSWLSFEHFFHCVDDALRNKGCDGRYKTRIASVLLCIGLRLGPTDET